jgi:hypothetical protein
MAFRLGLRQELIHRLDQRLDPAYAKIRLCLFQQPDPPASRREVTLQFDVPGAILHRIEPVG